MRCLTILVPLVSLGLTLACGGGGSGSRTTPTGSLTVQFGSDSLPGYAQAVVSLEKVEGTMDGTNWLPLGNVKATFDLMALQNGNSAVILPATQVNAGTYAQFRITWALVNYQSAIQQPAYVVPSSGTGQLLSMPTTTVVGGVVGVPTNGSATAKLMLSGQQAVQLRPVGTNATFTFQATGVALDASATARITGHLGDGSTPLAGAEVFAETVDGTGLASIQRRAFTDTSGNYTLEGLPTGGLFYVVSQPSGSLTAYTALAAAPVTTTLATAYTVNLPFSSPQTPGSLTLTITPPSSTTQGTWGELRKTLATGSTDSQTLIVRSQSVATGLTQDQAGIVGLAPDSYGVTAQRSTSGATPVMVKGTTVLVSANATTMTLLTYP
jgi:hypothetical protein